MSNEYNRPIAIIDSGIGGLAVYKRMQKKLKNENYIYFADNANFPYGNLKKEKLKKILLHICTNLIKTYDVKAIILACNTATTNALQYLQKTLSCKVYGIEPFSGIKDKDNTLVISTKLTAASCKDKQVNIISLPVLASAIEQYILSDEKIDSIIKNQIDFELVKKYKNIVLGCTHYQLVAQNFMRVFDNINFIDPSRASVNNIITDLKQNSLLSDAAKKGSLTLLGTGTEKDLQKIEQIIRRK